MTAALVSSIKEIAVPIDLKDPQREALFAQGLKLALGGEGVVTLIHAAHNPVSANWLDMPTAREMLHRWGVIEDQATYEDFAKLHVRVCPVTVSGPDTAAALQSELVRRAPDLLIIGNHNRSGVQRLIRGSIAESVVRKTHLPALFLGENAQPMVDPATGATKIQKILVPISNNLNQQPLIDYLQRLLYTLAATPVLVTFVHCGGAADAMPALDLPSRPDWAFHTDRRGGPVVDGILAAATEHKVDLIAMATEGHNSLVDAIVGSKTERVIHRSPVPVLAVPVG